MHPGRYMYYLLLGMSFDFNLLQSKHFPSFRAQGSKTQLPQLPQLDIVHNEDRNHEISDSMQVLSVDETENIHHEEGTGN